MTARHKLTGRPLRLLEPVRNGIGVYDDAGSYVRCAADMVSEDQPMTVLPVFGKDVYRKFIWAAGVKLHTQGRAQ